MIEKGPLMKNPVRGGSTDGVLNLEVSQHPEKLGRDRRVLTKVYQGNCGWQAGTQAGTAAAVDCWSCGAVSTPSTNLGGSGASVARGRFFWGILLLGGLCNGSFCGFLSAPLESILRLILLWKCDRRQLRRPWP
jgi:hypothetical protein